MGYVNFNNLQLSDPAPFLSTSEPLSHAASSTESSFARIPPILLKAGIWMPYFSSSIFMLLISSSAGEDRAEGTDQKQERAGFKEARDVERSWLVFNNQITDSRTESQAGSRVSQEKLLMTLTFTTAAGWEKKLPFPF